MDSMIKLQENMVILTLGIILWMFLIEWILQQLF